MNDEYGIYEFDISITLRRMTDRYNSTNLVRFESKQELPATDDLAARTKLSDLVNEALVKSDAIVGQRISFDNTVKAIGAGNQHDDIDA